MSGFVLLHRTALDHPLFQGDSARLGAWFWLVSRACWKPTPFNISGKMVTLERGQVCVSIRTLADEWGWSKSSVDRFVTRLKTETMIETEAGQGRLIITICNYSKYQDLEEGGRDSSGTATGTAAGQQRDIKEQGNKGTRKEERADALSSKRARASAATQHPMPDGWQPQQFEKRALARGIVDGWPPGQLNHQIEAFKAFHAAKASRFSNWQQAWATWVLNSRNFGHGNRKSNLGPHDNRDGLQRYLDEKLGIGEA